jgi:hypothetical protein
MPISNYGLLASGSGGGVWGSITGTLSAQTDLNSALNGKQATLVSGTNIKTINSTTLLGSGDIAISGSVSDGDKGDITVSGSGATWTIDNDAVTTAKILNSNVTLAKVENISTSTILGRVTASTGVTEQLTATQVRTLLNVEDGADVTDLTNVLASLNTIGSVAEGDILYRDGSGWVRLARGTDNQVLTATATTINWETPASGFADPMTTEGDIIYRTSGGVTTRLGKGTDGQVLTATADSINWENASGGGITWGTGTEASTSLSFGTNKYYQITLSAGGFAFETVFDFTTLTKEDGVVVAEVTNSSGASRNLTATSPNNFADLYPIANNGISAFSIYKNNSGDIRILGGGAVV